MGESEEVLRELEELRRANREFQEYRASMEAERGRLTSEMESLRLNANRRVNLSPQPVRKDLGLQSLIKPWSGETGASSVEEFLNNIEMVAATGHWEDVDKRMICRLKLSGPAAACVDAHPELSTPEATFSQFKEVLKRRFIGEEDPQRSLLALNTARQRSGESSRSFGDRCRMLGLKALLKTADPQESAWARKQMDRTVLAAFVRGLLGEAATTLQIFPPKDLDEAMKIVERYEQVQTVNKSTRGVFMASDLGEVEKSHELQEVALVRPAAQHRVNVCFGCGGTGHFLRQCPSNRGAVGNKSPSIATKDARVTNSKNKGNSRPFYCFVCGAPGHFASQCPRRAQMQASAQSNDSSKPSANTVEGKPPHPNGSGSTSAPMSSP